MDARNNPYSPGAGNLPLELAGRRLNWLADAFSTVSSRVLLRITTRGQTSEPFREGIEAPR